MILKKFGKVGVHSTKSSVSDVVTEADLEANHMLVGSIQKKYPHHGIVSEEENAYRPNAEYVWFVDPLDGSMNFATRVPLFGVMVGLAYRGRMELAAIFDPVHNELFFAQRGKGAYRNGRRIYCSSRKELSHSSGYANVNFTFFVEEKIKLMKKLLAAVKKEPMRMSSFGSMAINAIYAADGRKDWLCSVGGKIWDFAAPSLILSEAGCKVTDMNGRPWAVKSSGHTLLAANPHLHKKLLKIVSK